MADISGKESHSQKVHRMTTRRNRKADCLVALTISVGLLFTFAAAGCGGGGAGGGTTNTNTNTERTRVSVTVNWGSRSRGIQSPGSALSAVMVIPGAGTNGGDFRWVLNRDASRADSYSDPQQSPVDAKTGQFNMTLQFFSQANGGGDVVGVASKDVTLARGAGDIGDVSVDGVVATVEVLPRQHVEVGQSVTPAFAAKDASGKTLALADGAASFSIVSGQDKASGSGRTLQGVSAGVAQIVATVDGKSSAAETLYVGSADLTLKAAGTRGDAPVTLQVAGGTPVFRGVSATDSATAKADWTAQVQITAPDGLADRQFVKWQRDGQDFSTSASLQFSPVDLGPSANLTAIYQPSTMPASGFAPNFNIAVDTKVEKIRWKQFPIRVYFDRSGFTAGDTESRLRVGMDRWVAATGGVVSYTVVNDPSQTDVTIRFGAPPVGNLGECQGTWQDQNGGTFLTSATILLRSNLQSDNVRPQPLESIAAHEFGHALGMMSNLSGSGHSTDTHDTMYPTGNEGVGLITARDLNTLANLYPDLFGGSRSVSRTSGTSTGATGTIRAY